ncbi:50S ribosomal protein L29 [Sphingomonas colocasiae]|jgi:large subunit ribosomal protein L29|uniref:Large ribosomal subunit protein uL29 n=1 Tax=Sphingomonas colocasiae TaxID=1848973 RepID=A0ABS7PMQ7_9SPHN|nr:50S ribosomal protein L29 [Sphingomonas colocasiae]MBY8822274.1 50S ribosomal protein L29 [Sphingomonas colocasiae]
MAKQSKAAPKDDLTVKTDDELSTQLGELKREQFNLRFQAATNQLEKPSRVREVRRTIARIKTLQTQRSAAAGK